MQTGPRRTEPFNAAELELLGHLDTILPLFHALPPFNPPREFHVIPLRYTDPGKTLLEGRPGPARFTVDFAFEFFVVDEYIAVAGVRVSINHPFELLGPAFFADEESPFYLLPPTIQGAGGQELFLRSAHPVGYQRVFPIGPAEPLWHENSAPFYRSVIRPHFNMVSHIAVTCFTRGGEPFWKPVSRERWIRAMIAHGNAVVATHREGGQFYAATEDTQRQIEELKRRIDRMRAAYSEEVTQQVYEQMIAVAPLSRALASDPETGEREYQKALAAAEEYREQRRRSEPEMMATFDAQEKQFIDALLARDALMTAERQAVADEDWDRLEEIGRENELSQLVYIADAGRHVTALERELASMSPAERSAPAWGFEIPESPPGPYRSFMMMEFSPKRPSGLVEPDSPGARAIIALDHAFFDRRTSDAQPLILTVAYWQKPPPMEAEPWVKMERRGVPREPGLTMLTDVWRHLDWRTLRGIVGQ
ncbi:MAG: hypothetical protein EA403_04940 [Spirochaetaceae bacterium]|nr:MAG: hypothetical protein EA403_04940 [Spirochaetaceae bacterium]